MRKDGVTLGLTNCAKDYSRRARSIGLERRNVQDLQDAMTHPGFKARHHRLLDELAAEYHQILLPTKRPLFLTIKVGTLKTASDLRQAVLDAGCEIGELASDIMNQPAFSAAIPQVEESIEFVYAFSEELGCPNVCTRIQSCKAGLQLGLKLCLPSDGPEIRRNYLDQPAGERLLIVMDPITDPYGSLRIFCIERKGDGLWLYGYNDDPDYLWGPIRWVFRK